jgi:hypothetical protein
MGSTLVPTGAPSTSAVGPSTPAATSAAAAPATTPAATGVPSATGTTPTTTASTPGATPAPGATAAPGTAPAGTTAAPGAPGTAPLSPDLSAREVLAIELGEAFSFDKKQPLENLSTGKTSLFGPLTALVRFTPSLRTNLRAQATYSNLAKGLQSTQLTGTYSFTRGQMGLTWFTRSQPELPKEKLQQDQIGINGGLFVWPGRIRLDAQVNYDLKAAQLQNDRLILTYTGECWGFHVEYRDFVSSTLKTHDWRFAISLKNIGQVLDFGIGNTTDTTQ